MQSKYSSAIVIKEEYTSDQVTNVGSIKMSDQNYSKCKIEFESNQNNNNYNILTENSTNTSEKTTEKNSPNFAESEKIKLKIFSVFIGKFHLCSEKLVCGKIDINLFVALPSKQFLNSFNLIKSIGEKDVLKARVFKNKENFLKDLEDKKENMVFFIGWIKLNGDVELKIAKTLLNFFRNNNLVASDYLGNRQEIFYMHSNKLEYIRNNGVFSGKLIPFSFFDFSKEYLKDSLIFILVRYEFKERIDYFNGYGKELNKTTVNFKFLKHILIPQYEQCEHQSKKDFFKHYLIKFDKDIHGKRIKNEAMKSLDSLLKEITSKFTNKIINFDANVTYSEFLYKKKQIDKLCNFISVSLNDVLNKETGYIFECKNNNNIIYNKNSEIKGRTKRSRSKTQRSKSRKKNTLEKKIKLNREESSKPSNSRSKNRYNLQNLLEEGEIITDKLNLETIKIGDFEEINFNLLKINENTLRKIEIKLISKDAQFCQNNFEKFHCMLGFIKSLTYKHDFRFIFYRSLVDNNWGSSLAEFLYEIKTLKNISIDFSYTNLKDYGFFLIIRSFKMIEKIDKIQLFFEFLDLSDDSAENLINSLENDRVWANVEEGFLSFKGVEFNEKIVERIQNIINDKYKKIQLAI